MISDPIADMLTRTRNAVAARHDFVLMPASKLKVSVARILKQEGFIRDFDVLYDNTPKKTLKITLKYTAKKQPVITGIQRVSKPGLRVYVQKAEIPRVYGGLGVAILSTPQGVMTGRDAWRKRTGGEILCYVW